MPPEKRPGEDGFRDGISQLRTAPRTYRGKYFSRILRLFLAAAIAPALAVSAVYSSVAGAALRREAESRARADAESFASAVGEIADRTARGLSELSRDPDILEALRAFPGTDPALSARVVRRIQSVFPREAGDAEAAVAAPDGSATLTPGGYIPDRDLGIHGSWGVFRMLRERPGELAISSQRGRAGSGEETVLTLALALRGNDGGVLGYAVAGIRRGAFVQAADRNRLLAEAAVLDPRGSIVFDFADPRREGFYEDELPAPAPEASRLEAPVPGTAQGFRVRTEIPTGLFTGFERTARTVAVLGLLGSVVVAAALALTASRSVTRPVLNLARSMRKVEAGDLSIRVEPAGNDELGDLARSFNAMTGEISALIQGALERQELLREAELRALAAQMNPHFLHNTLAAIKSLAKLGRSAEVAEVATRLGKILRAGAERREEFTTVGESLDLVRDYLAVEKLRFGDRFRYRIDTAPELENVPIPPLVLEPLAENALTHGLERKSGPGFLLVTGRVEGKDAVMAVEDDGPGAAPETLAEISRVLAEGSVSEGKHGMGLAGTNRRLRLEYGPGYGVTAGPGPDGTTGFRVEVRFPLRPDTPPPSGIPS